MTIYKPIPEYEKIYEAGDDGTIWSCEGKTTYRVLKGKKQLRKWNRRMIKPKSEKRNRSKHSDLRVELWKNGKHKTQLVSRLVAKAFVPNPDNKPCINHIDGNPLNNKPENLEWCTYKENQVHAFKHGLNKASTKVLLKSDRNGFKKTFFSMAEASKWLGFNNGYISGILSRGITHVGEYEIVLI
ncbi:HNH endonuclease [Lactobacillus amylolyticus]|uniref:HNH endonuclease n=1 Tax=Lactobacillus amylolyticus TaxID=83683 RepID=UPI002490F4D7|nr:HNH endonuclease [Lactobacillus amylolyticus]